MPKPGWVSGLDILMGAVLVVLLFYVLVVGILSWREERARRQERARRWGGR